MSTTNLSGRTVVVTGASSGIGLHTAIGLAEHGAHVLAHARTETKTGAMADQIRKTGNTNVTPAFADLSTMAGVRQLAAQLAGHQIDVVINNAGAAYSSFATTTDGFERTFAVNHLSGALLIELLLDQLRASSDARVINLSSSLAKKATFDANKPWTEDDYNGLKAYATSKYWATLYANALAQQHLGDNIRAYAVDPGAVATEFGKKAGGPLKMMMAVAKPFMASPNKGARSSVWAATTEPPPASGSFITRGKPGDGPPFDKQRINDVWRRTRQLLQLDPKS